MSNAGGMSTVTRYVDMLAGNTTWSPWEPAGAYDALATVTVPSGGAASITFAGIPTGYKHLQLRGNLKTTNASTDGSPMTLTANGDTTHTNYYTHQLQGNGSTAASYSVQASSWQGAGVGNAPDANLTSIFGAFVIDILDYASVTKNKTFRTLSGFDANGSGLINLWSGLWMNSSTPITTLTTQFPQGRSLAQHSTFALYGVK